MSDFGIDKLSLDITVKENGSTQKVDDLAAAISNLNEKVSQINFGGAINPSQINGITNIGEGLKQVGKIATNVSDEIRSLAKEYDNLRNKGKLSHEEGKRFFELRAKLEGEGALKQDLTVKEKYLQEPKAKAGEAPQITSNIEEQSNIIGSIVNKVDLYKAKLDIVSNKIAQGNLGLEEYVRLSQQKLSIEDKLAKMGRDALGIQDKETKSNKNKLLESIKRISLYRLIRAFLKLIVQSAKEILDNIEDIAPRLSKQVNKLKQDLLGVKASFGIVGTSLLVALEPIIRVFTTGLIRMANDTARVLAMFSETGEAIVINEKKLEKFNATQKKGSLLAFDTFTKLSNQGSAIADITDTETVPNVFYKIIKPFQDLLDIISPSGSSGLLGGDIMGQKGLGGVNSSLLEILQGRWLINSLKNWLAKKFTLPSVPSNPQEEEGDYTPTSRDDWWNNQTPPTGYAIDTDALSDAIARGVSEGVGKIQFPQPLTSSEISNAVTSALGAYGVSKLKGSDINVNIPQPFTIEELTTAFTSALGAYGVSKLSYEELTKILSGGGGQPPISIGADATLDDALEVIRNAYQGLEGDLALQKATNADLTLQLEGLQLDYKSLQGDYQSLQDELKLAKETSRVTKPQIDLELLKTLVDNLNSELETAPIEQVNEDFADLSSIFKELYGIDVEQTEELSNLLNSYKELDKKVKELNIPFTSLSQNIELATELIKYKFIKDLPKLIGGLALILFSSVAAFFTAGFGAVGLIPGVWLSGLGLGWFADGGMMNGFQGTGSMYIAGEAGAEIVATGSKGTGVANVQQIAEAVQIGTYNALMNYGASRGGSQGDVYIDGIKVGKLTAKSSYQEMVRQNLIRVGV